jgi:hypothetical protein
MSSKLIATSSASTISTDHHDAASDTDPITQTIGELPSDSIIAEYSALVAKLNMVAHTTLADLYSQYFNPAYIHFPPASDIAPTSTRLAALVAQYPALTSIDTAPAGNSRLTHLIFKYNIPPPALHAATYIWIFNDAARIYYVIMPAASHELAIRKAMICCIAKGLDPCCTYWVMCQRINGIEPVITGCFFTTDFAELCRSNPHISQLVDTYGIDSGYIITCNLAYKYEIL